MKSYENTKKVGPIHLFQIASACLFALPTFRYFPSVRESDFPAQMIWWYCALAHLRERWTVVRLACSQTERLVIVRPNPVG